MKRAMRLVVEEPRRRDDRLLVSARIEYPRGGKDRIWFSTPRETGVPFATAADPFIIGCFALAMSRGCALRAEGITSPQLLRNLEAVQDYYVSSWPAFYRKVEITADRLNENETKKPGAIVAFSGGVDSCYTLLRHARHLGPRPFYDIQAAVMVHGLDIPLAEREGFARAAARNRVITTSLGVPLFEVATNLRELPIIWEHTCGPAVAAALSLFASRFGYGLMASSHQVKGNILGSHPDIDPLYSSGCFEIVHDSAYVHKLDKAVMLKDWPEAMKHLRVCWEGKNRSSNCCRCEKCIRTILIFRAHGILPPCFERDITDAEIRAMQIFQVNVSGTYIPLLARLREQGIRGSWVDTLEARVAWHQKHPHRKLKDYLPPAVVVRLYRAQARWRAASKHLTGRG